MGTEVVTDLAHKRIADVVADLRAADASAEEAEARRWAAAEKIAELLASGWSTRGIAADIEAMGYRTMSYKAVMYYGYVWDRFGNQGSHSRISFTDAFAKVKRAPEEPPAEEDPEDGLPTPVGKWKRAVLDTVVDAGAEGITEPEMARVLCVQQQTFTHSRIALVTEGWIVEGGKRNGARVWLLSEEGAEQLGVPGGWTSSLGPRNWPPPEWVEEWAATSAGRDAEKIVKKLQGTTKAASKLRAAIQALPSQSKTTRVVQQKAAEVDREIRRQERQTIEAARANAERLEKIGDPYAPAHRLYAELRDMEARLGGFESTVKHGPDIFAVRQQDLVNLSEDVANAAYDLMDILKGTSAPEAHDVPPKKRQALPPTS